MTGNHMKEMKASLCDDFLIGRVLINGAPTLAISVSLIPRVVEESEWAECVGMIEVVTKIPGLRSGEWLEESELELIKMLEKINFLTGSDSFIYLALQDLVRVSFLAGLKYSTAAVEEIISVSTPP